MQVAIATGGGSLGGATSAPTDGNGRAAFTDLSITGSPGTRTLRFSATNFAAVTSGHDQSAPSPTVTTITADTPDPSRTGDLVTVQLHRHFGERRHRRDPCRSPTAANTCTGTLSGGKGSCALALTTTGSRTLTATYAGANGFGASSDTEAHTVQAAPPPVLAIATQPASQATSGVALNPQPVVQLKTGDGANLATAGVAVSVTVQGGGTLSGTSPVVDRRQWARQLHRPGHLRRSRHAHAGVHGGRIHVGDVVVHHRRGGPAEPRRNRASSRTRRRSRREARAPSR